VGYLRAHLKRLGAGDYLPLLAYVQMNQQHENTLGSMRIGDFEQEARGHLSGVRAALPAFHRSGLQRRPQSGVFLQVTCDDAQDLPVPGPEIHVRRRQGSASSR